MSSSKPVKKKISLGNLMGSASKSQNKPSDDESASPSLPRASITKSLRRSSSNVEMGNNTPPRNNSHRLLKKPSAPIVQNPVSMPSSMYNVSDVPMPPVEAVQTMLELLMEDLNLTEEKKQVLRMLPNERKWGMLQQHLGERYRDGASQTTQQDVQEIQKLRDSPDKELLTNLVVSLRSRPIRWISNFIENGGLAILLDNLKALEDENRHDDFEELYIKCLKSLMNNKIGLSAVLDHDESLNIIALSLRSPSARTRALVLEIFGAVCLIPGGHRCVLEGMDALQEIAGMRYRFEIVVHSLWQSCQGGTPLDKELQEIGFIENELLQTQIDVWIAGLEADEEESFAKVDTDFVNIDDPEDVMKFMLLIDKIVQQISVQRDSEDPDPAAALTDIDVRGIVADLEAIERAKRLEKEVEQLKTSKGDAKGDKIVTADVASLNAQLAAAKKDIMELENLLRERILNVEGGSEILERPTGSGPPPPPPPPPMLGGGPPPPPPPPPMMGGGTTASTSTSTTSNDGWWTPSSSPSSWIRWPPTSTTSTTYDGRWTTPSPTSSRFRRPTSTPSTSWHGWSSTTSSTSRYGRSPTTPLRLQAWVVLHLLHPPAVPPAPLHLPAAAFARQPSTPVLPAKATNLSSKPLKSFNWTKIAPQKAKETIFAALDDNEVHSALKDTYRDFEDLFAAKEIKKDFTKTTSSESVGPKEITFLDPKRSQNTNIMLKAIKISVQDIKKAITTFDLDVLGHHILSELLKVVPTDEELASLKQYENDVDNLASAEKFLFAMSEITHYEKKLKAMFFKSAYDEYMDDAETLVTSLRRATEDVKESKKFKEMLKVILALGNYMNSGQRGGAYGFKLNSILKMADTKSTITNRKHTLLHYLTELIPKKFPEIVGFQDELAHVEDGAKVTIPAIRQVLMTIRENLKTSENLVNILEKEEGAVPVPAPAPADPKSGRVSPSKLKPAAATGKNAFLVTLKTFYQSAQSAYEELDAKFKTADKEFEGLVNVYGEDPKVTTPEEFFGIFFKFVQSYNAAKADNEHAVAKAVEAEKKEVEKRNMEERRKKKREGATRGDSSKASGGAGDADHGGLDDLISAIRTGKAFGGGDAPQRKRANPPGVRDTSPHPATAKEGGRDSSSRKKGGNDLAPPEKDRGEGRRSHEKEGSSTKKGTRPRGDSHSKSPTKQLQHT
ncbi:hypothetical protein BC829DRAFT_445004 [Chytridium lagenaria]|nr:hypothetical protein BC829DRAFT_445004 [Chytridium lagenaria]